MADDWTNPPPAFKAILFHHGSRFYYITYGKTLIGPAVVRMWGSRERNQQQFLISNQGETLQEAWPTIRKHIRRRLDHGYQIVTPP
jgi:hypothetical protein